LGDLVKVVMTPYAECMKCCFVLHCKQANFILCRFHTKNRKNENDLNGSKEWGVSRMCHCDPQLYSLESGQIGEDIH
jgi:hypothetical protein